MARAWRAGHLSVLDRYFAASEERHALVDDEFKDCGEFLLSPFERPADHEFTGVEDFAAAVQRVMVRADDFYAVDSGVHDFALADASLTYSSALCDGTANDNVSVQVISRRRSAGKAVVIVPHWNAKHGDYVDVANTLSWFGFDGFILTLPHHGTRAPLSPTHVANAFLNADLGAAIRSVRQAVLDVKLLTGWLKLNGYKDVYLVGASLGSCVASLAAAFDPRISRCALLLSAGDFADTVWTGRATAQIRKAIEKNIGLEQLRKAWAIISPLNFADNFAANGSRIFIVSGARDEVVRIGLATDFVDALTDAGVDVQWRVLPCGHYTLSMFPFSIMMIVDLLKFLTK